MNDNINEQKISEALSKSGIPFEVTVRKALKDLGIVTFASRYFERNQYGEVSKDIDALGNVKFKTFENKAQNLHPCLQLRLVSEVKEWKNSAICFFDIDGEEPENLNFVFPNFLFINSPLLGYAGGYTLLSEFYKNFGEVLVSKSVVYLQKNIDKWEEKKGKEGGNYPVFEASGKLLNACEYLHKKSISWITDENGFKFNGLFPVIITNAKLYRGDVNRGIEIEEKEMFFYLVACKDLDKIPITAKERLYLPILIVNYDALGEAIRLLSAISEKLYNLIEKYVKERPEIFREEYRQYAKYLKLLPEDRYVKQLN